MELIFKFEQLWIFLMFFGTFSCIYFCTKIPTWLPKEEIQKGFFKRKGTNNFFGGLISSAIAIFGCAMYIPIFRTF